LVRKDAEEDGCSLSHRPHLKKVAIKRRVAVTQAGRLVQDDHDIAPCVDRLPNLGPVVEPSTEGGQDLAQQLLLATPFGTSGNG
jgi:hypothetical protein